MVVGEVFVGFEGGVEGIRRDEPLLVPMAEGGLELAQSFAWESVGGLAGGVVVVDVELVWHAFGTPERRAQLK